MSENDAGFTLLEVVVSVAIVSMAFASLFSMLSSAKFQTINMSKRAEGVALGASLLEEHLITPRLLEFPIEETNEVWQWAIELEEYDTDEEEADEVEGAPYVATITLTHIPGLYTQNIELKRLVWIDE